MFLHHYITLILIVFSYASNFSRAGGMVLFVHDWSEVFVALCRIFVDLKFGEPITMGAFVVMLISWAISRCYIYPKDVILGIQYSGSKYNVHYNNYFMILLLWMLWVLHVYWLCLFSKMAYHLIVHKEAKDMVADGSSTRKNN